MHYSDLIWYGLLQLASKSSCRWGDGQAQIALWKIWMPDYWIQGHVSKINQGSKK